METGIGDGVARDCWFIAAFLFTAELEAELIRADDASVEALAFSLLARDAPAAGSAGMGAAVECAKVESSGLESKGLESTGVEFAAMGSAPAAATADASSPSCSCFTCFAFFGSFRFDVVVISVLASAALANGFRHVAASTACDRFAPSFSLRPHRPVDGGLVDSLDQPTDHPTDHSARVPFNGRIIRPSDRPVNPTVNRTKKRPIHG